MLTVDIPTTQNVTIQYELASTKERFVAALLDFIFLFVVLLIINLLLNYIVGLIFRKAEFLYILVNSLIIIFYSFSQEVILKGQTFGKKMMGIRVMRLDGQKPQPFNYMARLAFKLIDIWASFGAIGITMIKSSGKGQRLGDIIGNTVIVRINPTYQPKLESIMNMITSKSYTPKYLDVIKFSEDDILTIKETLDRYNKYKNEAHRYALTTLASKLLRDLNLKEKISDPSVFLRTIIQDYVVLTR